MSITSKSDLEHVARRLEALKIAPDMGIVYDPLYKAARPRHALRVTYAGNYGIYYLVDTTTQTVVIEAIEDQRRDPNGCFQM